MNECDPDEAESIANAQSTIVKPNVKKDLAFIKCNFACLSVGITKIQAQSVPLTEAIETFFSVREKLVTISKRPEFLDKFDYVANKNKGLATLQKIASVLDGVKMSKPDAYIDRLSSNELAAFKYAPVVSCDVERSFSGYKRILEDCRRSFLFDNLRKHVIIHCNKFD